MAVSWPSCTTPSTRAPMSMAAPRLAVRACPARSRGSRAGHARSGPRTGRSSSPGIIPATSPGTSSCGTSSGSIDNRTSPDEDRRGALREGLALLQGLVRCGRCGRRMTVRYLKNGSIPSYECNSVHTHYAGATCQSIRGDGIDAAVARAFLEAMRPAQLEVSMAAFDQIAAQARQLDRQWQLTLERARYEAELARRRFVAVEPENRLVARTLEREWNEKLAEIERLERDAAAPPSAGEPAGRSRGAAADPGPGPGSAGGLACPDDAPDRSQTTAGIFDQGCDLCRGETTIQVAIRWQTEACTVLEVPRPQRSYEVRRTDPAVVARVRALAPDTHRPPDRRPAGSGGFPIRDRASLHANKVQQIQICLFDPQWLSRGAGRVPGGLSGGWTLFGPGRGGAAERECLHDRRLVPIGPPGWHPGGAPRPLVDQADAGDHRRACASQPVAPGPGDRSHDRDRAHGSGPDLLRSIPNPLAKRCSMNDRSECPAAFACHPVWGCTRVGPAGDDTFRS